MIYYLPLEHIDMRYTKHLDERVINFLERSDLDFIRIYPNMNDREKAPPPKGFFLNAPSTMEFKLRQLSELAQLYPDMEDGDIVFTSDLWMPGLESIFYMNYFMRKNIRVRGILHAGSFTDTDFVRDMERWALQFENLIFDQVDKIFVASDFIKNDVSIKRVVNPDKIEVTPFPLDSRLVAYRNDKPKQNIVIFNGRLCDEKQPYLFDLLKEKYSDRALFIKTQERNYSKKEYYDLLSKAKAVVSYALQENFGFGIQEAVYLGCIPVLPNRLVYPSQFEKKYLFDTFEQSCEILEKALDDRLDVPEVSLDHDISGWFL